MNLTYRAAQSFSYIYFRLFHGLKIQGLENIPKVNAFILACNHLSFFDPPAIGCRIPRNLHYFARDSLFHGPMGFLIRKLNSIPVNRKQLDIKTLRIVLKVWPVGNPFFYFLKALDQKVEVFKKLKAVWVFWLLKAAYLLCQLESLVQIKL